MPLAVRNIRMFCPTSLSTGSIIFAEFEGRRAGREHDRYIYNYRRLADYNYRRLADGGQCTIGGRTPASAKFLASSAVAGEDRTIFPSPVIRWVTEPGSFATSMRNACKAARTSSGSAMYCRMTSASSGSALQ